MKNKRLPASSDFPVRTRLLTVCLASTATLFSSLAVGNPATERAYIRNSKEFKPAISIRNGQLADRSVSGRITDDTGAGLPGVSVLIKGTTRGTTSDANGNYSLTVPDQGRTVLIFSFVGYQSKEVEVGSQTSVSVALVTDDKALNEVVVVGYGTQKKAEVTGAVVVATGEQLNKRIATNPATLLQGQLPGLQVQQSSGEPGNEGVSLRIRGVGTFSGAGNDPLVIVDGLPGSLTNLNPNDVASVSVLKDAASAAIYGARGANGVIVITTKKGKSGKVSVGYTFNNGITRPTKLPTVIDNSAEFMELSNEARSNSGLNPIYPQSTIDLYRNATDRVKYPNHNWLDDIFRTVNVQNHYLNVNGGAGNTNYSVGLGYTNQPGVVRGFNFQKYTLQFNLSSKVNDFITFGTNTLLRYSNRKGPSSGAGDTFLATLAQSPLYGPTLPDGSGLYTYRAYNGEVGNKNPVASADNVTTTTDDYYAQVNGFINVKLAEGLQWETRGGINFGYWKSNDFRPRIPVYYYSDLTQAGLLDVGTLGLSVNSSNTAYTVLYSQLTYDKQIGKNHFTVLGGAQQEQNKDQSLGGFRREFATNTLRELNAGPVEGQTNYGGASQWAIRSFYGRANYDYQNRYLVEASARYDGTSRLPTATRWGLFYAGSVGWRLTEEAFMKNITWLNDLKLRASYGKLGNQNIGTYPYQNALSTANYPFNNSLQTGYYAAGLVDQSLTWETTQSVDLGFDLAALNGRLTVSADWFNKETYDILRSYQVPLYVGLNAPTVNNGRVRNTGFEIELAYRDKIGKDFTYQIGGNVQAYKNRLVQYGSREIGGQTIREEGRPLDEFFLYQWDGIFQSQEEINRSPKQPITPQPGDLKIKDVNGDGKIDASDRTYTPGRYPTMSYNLNANASWRNFDLSVQVFGSAGQRLYVTGWGAEPFRQGSVPTTDWRNRWTPSNPSTTMPRIYWADGYAPVQNYASTYFLKDASFVRLKNVQIGYTLPNTLVSKAKMQSLRVYFAGDNLLTLSKFPGLDPERTAVTDNYVSYPQNQVFTLGATVQF
ncbi:TonB-dependent receptor [Spirosoma sp. RP8]|uniref:TonB-dependent receptor n=1 Tax=Spirosoma liriopis TaxID=2937440 RepID=A0ABT0HTC5_9BACT|nr:TonB-dependent receptor [Spirosoma liriopis]MCK8495454.1 TonB-dependent receptor [Spirosoma liriopis]